MTDWYFNKDGKKYGPVDTAGLIKLAREGKLLPADMIWREGLAEYVPAAQAKGLFGKDINTIKNNEENNQPSTNGRNDDQNDITGISTEAKVIAISIGACVLILGSFLLWAFVLRDTWGNLQNLTYDVVKTDSYGSPLVVNISYERHSENRWHHHYRLNLAYLEGNWLLKKVEERSGHSSTIDSQKWNEDLQGPNLMGPRLEPVPWREDTPDSAGFYLLERDLGLERGQKSQWTLEEVKK